MELPSHLPKERNEQKLNGFRVFLLFLFAYHRHLRHYRHFALPYNGDFSGQMQGKSEKNLFSH